MSVFWTIAGFFLLYFFKGFIAGCALRLLIALIFKGDATWQGTMRLGALVGIIYLILTCYMAGIF